MISKNEQTKRNEFKATLLDNVMQLNDLLLIEVNREHQKLHPTANNQLIRLAEVTQKFSQMYLTINYEH
ncbi:hypothetical protein FHQ08_11960 [Lactobacillus sp. CC-MHH1034]|uniref:hypothetical protein n=1 Tax=Agrilactobacillus fermenti TaxID=2586909 RepID=UPI001E4B48B6|nr:hypothetical protein [Agrilactobacillus fermenti]MCD2257401.1 hypothetical protein [Agrilactobacillus fermenti]